MVHVFSFFSLDENDFDEIVRISHMVQSSCYPTRIIFISKTNRNVEELARYSIRARENFCTFLIVRQRDIFTVLSENYFLIYVAIRQFMLARTTFHIVVFGISSELDYNYQL